MKSMNRVAVLTALLFLTAPVALADHGRAESRSMVRIVEDLQEATVAVHERASFFAVRGRGVSALEARTLRSLDALEREAFRFERAVRQADGRKWRLQDDFLRLEDAFFRADENLGRLRGQGRFKRDWDRVEVLMARLDRAVSDVAPRRAAPRRAVPRRVALDHPTGLSVVIEADGRGRPTVDVHYRR